jgi:hypothetical protein
MTWPQGLLSMTWQLALCGYAGAAVPDLLRLIGLRHRKTPAFVTKGLVVGSLVFSVWCGGGTAIYLHPGDPLAAFLIGYAVPQLISKIFGSERAEEQPLDTYALGIPAVWRIQRWSAL